MKLPRPIHRWNVTPSQAIAIQRRLADRVIVEKPRHPIRFVAGLDAAFPSGGETCLAAVVLWDIKQKEVVEEYTASAPLRMPYIPGLLSFREAPALLAVLRKLKHDIDVLMCDGQGMAHQRRLGIACHMGIVTGLPSIGCAKSILVGKHKPLGTRRGSRAVLIDKGERVGTVLRTRDGVKPVYVSIGHRMDLQTAERIVLQCGMGYRLPEPTRRADHVVSLARVQDTD